MYIVYERSQRLISDTDGATIGHWIGNAPSLLEVPKFKPTWLIRVADSEIVRGSDVDDHYWALSYSWSQSGEIIHKGDDEYERVDEHKHKIISSSGTSRFVSFGYLIRQICIDFDIRYIWYDQVCIDQDNHNAKVREIRQMHRIYENAFSTLALVPELELISGLRANIHVLSKAQWSERMWTLEEAYMSRSLLVVGRNVHFWSHNIRSDDINRFSKTSAFLTNIRHGKVDKWRACTALWYARTRTSTKAHDRIFALANIFPELKNGIDFNYYQPVHDLMIQFYGLMAQKDHSILLFGAPIESSNGEDEESTIRQKEPSMLPSWTGTNGVHIPQSHLKCTRTEPYFCCTVDRDYMSLTSEFILVRIKPATLVEKADSSSRELYGLTLDCLPCNTLSFPADLLHKSKYLTFVTTTKASQKKYDNYMAPYGLTATHFMPMRFEIESVVNTLSIPTKIGGLLSLTDDSSECIILSGLKFNIDDPFRCHPVIKKAKSHYISIGLCFLNENLDVNFLLQSKQTFLIK